MVSLRVTLESAPNLTDGLEECLLSLNYCSDYVAQRMCSIWMYSWNIVITRRLSEDMFYSRTFHKSHKSMARGNNESGVEVAIVPLVFDVGGDEQRDRSKLWNGMRRCRFA